MSAKEVLCLFKYQYVYDIHTAQLKIMWWGQHRKKLAR